jgi:hypothetical protein
LWNQADRLTQTGRSEDAAGLFAEVLQKQDLVAYAMVVMVIGLFIVFVIAPITVDQWVRNQSNVIKDDHHMTLDDEWVTISYPLAESRFRWAGLDRIIETPDVWYVMCGKMQAITIPKDRMSDDQRAEFAAFVDLRSSTVR